MGKKNDQIAPTTPSTNAPTPSSSFVATTTNAPHMTDPMRANVNARADVTERREIVALYEQLTSNRDTLSDNDAKSIRRALRARNFRISTFTRTSTDAIVQRALASMK